MSDLERPGESESWDVFIVDSDPSTRKELEFVTAACGYTVRVFDDGRIALHALRRTVPRIVVVELLLSGIDGLELCRLIRSELGYEELPILCMSGSAGGESDLPLLVERRFKARFLRKSNLTNQYLPLVDDAIGPPRNLSRTTSPRPDDPRRRNGGDSVPTLARSRESGSKLDCASSQRWSRLPPQHEYTIEFHTTRDFVAEYTHNIRCGGIFVRSANLPPLDHVIRLQLLILGKVRVDLQARVVFLVPPQHAQRNGGHTGFGVEFVDLPKDRLRFMEELSRSMA